MAYIGNEPSVNFTSFAKQDITGDGGASYTLTYAVANANEIEVFVNNVRQEPSVAYTVSGTALSMTGNVASTDDFYVIYLGKALQTTVPPDGSVSTAKLVDSAVTNAKIANSTIDLTSKVTGVLPNANIIGQTTRPTFYAANLDGATFNSGTLTGADTSGYGYTNGSMSYNSSTGELTVPIAGLYMISFGILVQPNSGRCEAVVQTRESSGSFSQKFVVDANGTSTYDTCGGNFTYILGANAVIKIIRNTGTAYAFAHPSHFINVAYIGG